MPAHTLSDGTQQPTMLTVAYDLMVIGCDIADLVSSAGGWIADRVLGGWRALAVLPPNPAHSKALRVLGVGLADHPYGPTMSRAAALAVSGQVLASDSCLRDEVRSLLRDNTCEVMLWGTQPVELDGPLTVTTRRMSSAARAFKVQALKAAQLSAQDVGEVERFYSSALTPV